MSDKLQVLEWDSQFFGFKVASIEKNFLDTGKDSEILQRLLEEHVKLTYYFTDSPLDESIFSEKFDVLLVDEKVPLIKQLNKKAVTHPKVSLYEKDTADENLIQLSTRAGEQSRFKVDPYIPSDKCRELFKIWIEKSVNKEMASDVLVYKEGSEIVGFITPHIKEGKAYASLMAVQKEYEGKGVSFALMNAIEDYLTTRNFTHIFTSTQLSNKKAIAIYRRHGLEVQPPVFVYHIWKK